MPKNTAQEIIDFGFTSSMFSKETDEELVTFVTAVLADQTLLLEGRIGSDAYAAASSPQKDWVKRAEACLTAAELLRRRIMRILGNVTGAGQELDTKEERKQLEAYLLEAQGKDGNGGLIARIVNDVGADSGTDLVSGFSSSNHFGTTNA